mmetsp:Transcript_20449/g.36767  ORF Transcript_20449/g.36767 Transcript_20449/m.36767 type:complete len:86 (-) Transcript_20449:1406-1663(-)
MLGPTLIKRKAQVVGARFRGSYSPIGMLKLVGVLQLQPVNKPGEISVVFVRLRQNMVTIDIVVRNDTSLVAAPTEATTKKRVSVT